MLCELCDRPAFMAEYEQLEDTLKGVYDVYIEKFRNLQYLEKELQKYELREMEKKNEADRALKKMRKMLRDEELRILRGEQDVDEDRIEDSGFDSDRVVSVCVRVCVCVCVRVCVCLSVSLFRSPEVNCVFVEII